MINLQFNLRIPGSNRFKNIKCCHGRLPITRHKFWEIQIYKGSDIIDFFLRVTTKQSHAGIHAGFGLFGFNVEFQIYDSRHWNQETNSWATYDR